MEQKLILYPLFTLVLWSFAMSMVMISRAFRAVGEGLNPEYFRYSRGYEIPDYMRSAYQHYSNLYEMPVLFYVAVLILYSCNATNILLYTLYWAYVVARIGHSLLHLSNNNLPRRRDAFMLSTLLLMVIWGITIWRTVQ